MTGSLLAFSCGFLAAYGIDLVAHHHDLRAAGSMWMVAVMIAARRFWW